MISTMSASLRMSVIAVLSVGMFGCSFSETTTDFFSSTSPGAWYTQDGLPKAEQKVNLFVAFNLDNLKTDLARGQGEYLTALSTLLQVPPQREHEFFALAQRRYPSLAREDRTVVSDTLIALSQHIGTAPQSGE